MDLVYNHNLVKLLSGAIDNGEGYLENVPGLFKEVVNKNAWMEHTTEMGKTITLTDFKEFVEKPYPDGLGTTLDKLKKLIEDDREALSMFTHLTTGKWGTNRYTIENDNINLYNTGGTSKEYGLRKLRKSSPELHERVIQGELSINKAMIEAGYRKKKVSVNIDSGAVAKMILKYFSKEDITDIIGMLGE